MPAFVVTYDLNKKKDYPKLYEAIKSYGAWCHVLDSFWVIKSTSTAVQIRDFLMKHVDKDDQLFVCKTATPGDGAWLELPSVQANWLVANL